MLAVCLAAGAGAAAATESLTLKRIAETGIISIGYRDASIPFSYLDGRQRPIGYSMDICHHIAEAARRRLKLADLSVKLTPLTSATRLPMVVNHAVDLECGTTTNTLERQEAVSFLITTFIATGRFLSKKSSRIDTVEDLRGKTVVSTAGTTSMRHLAELNATRGLQMKIVAGKDHAESFRIVETDRAAAFAMDDVLLHSLAATTKRPSAYHISGEPLSIEPYGIVVRKNDPAFKRLADEVILDLFRSGEISRIYQKWFQSPIPPRQINLQLPMSAQLMKAIVQPTDSGDPANYK
ncbi:amino acid ABC transporter substrate-binding protein [Aquincola sp. S2]|uniref:Amino acid ABC transporter substrate-binding protein n=1 Tax=Pseudaquabacterium terrae TaxID=2732868 RepID=A0ABX2EGS0_9BURK|nr:amino acid ABC transporter substrate-binding protein [Aquabacterium terrae]NRF67818.1 amino acid ABC transporter substrate-binding protein [Aquabacterium terrae]